MLMQRADSGPTDLIFRRISSLLRAWRVLGTSGRIPFLDPDIGQLMCLYSRNSSFPRRGSFNSAPKPSMF
jgi:hypothetical protein